MLADRGPFVEQTLVGFLPGFRVGLWILPLAGLSVSGLLLVEQPKTFVVFAGHWDQRPPVQIAEYMKPEDFVLALQVHIVGLDNVDERKLDGGGGR